MLYTKCARFFKSAAVTAFIVGFSPMIGLVYAKKHIGIKIARNAIEEWGAFGGLAGLLAGNALVAVLFLPALAATIAVTAPMGIAAIALIGVSAIIVSPIARLMDGIASLFKSRRPRPSGGDSPSALRNDVESTENPKVVRQAATSNGRIVDFRGKQSALQANSISQVPYTGLEQPASGTQQGFNVSLR